MKDISEMFVRTQYRTNIAHNTAQTVYLCQPSAADAVRGRRSKVRSGFFMISYRSY